MINYSRLGYEIKRDFTNFFGKIKYIQVPYQLTIYIRSIQKSNVHLRI